jgi:Domain of unknown function (DUF6894)
MAARVPSPGAVRLRPELHFWQVISVASETRVSDVRVIERGKTRQFHCDSKSRTVPVQQRNLRNAPPSVRLILMARFFFHLTDGTSLRDHEGEDCASMEQAKGYAVQTASELARNKEPSQVNGLYVCVTDESSAEVFRTPLLAAHLS